MTEDTNRKSSEDRQEITTGELRSEGSSQAVMNLGISAADGESNLFLAIEKTGRLDRWMESANKWINPILVKETRQSLKSNQFVITFSLVLLAVLFWSFISVAFSDLDNSYASEFVLLGYTWIMFGPMLVIVPVSSFWSIASEKEENSLELITLTTMKPAQIASGKFVTALMQLMIYLSVLAPCICFTYLLRGIEFRHIAVVLISTTTLSVSLVALGLFLATSVRNRALQIIFLVAFVIACFATTLWMGAMLAEIEYLVDDVSVGENLLGFAGLLLCIASYGIVSYFATISNLTFDTDNGSTRIRGALVFQQSIFFGWSFVLCASFGGFSIPFVLMFATIHWMIICFLLVGENNELSQRVRRSLPQSGFAQLFLSWMMPGPARGLFFAFSNLLGLMTAIVLMALYVEASAGGVSLFDSWLGADACFLTMLTCIVFLTIYGGITYLFMNAIRRRGIPRQMGPIVSLIIGVCVVTLFNITPLVVVGMLDLNVVDASPICFTSFFVIFATTMDGEYSLVSFLLSGILAAIVAAKVVFSTRRELSYQHEEDPDRVKLEDNPVQAEPDIFD